jgi:hypothetical protein
MTLPRTERAMSVISFGPLVDQQHDQVDFRMVGRRHSRGRSQIAVIDSPTNWKP